MKRKIKVVHIYLLTFLLFYFGIFILLRNIPGLNYFAIVLVMIALLFSGVPDPLINMELIHVNICWYKSDLITRIIVFMLTYFYLKNFTYPEIFLLIIGLSIINVVSAFMIWREVKNVSLSADEIKEKLQQVNDEKTAKVLPYLAGYSICAAFFANMQDSFGETLICGIIYLFVNVYIVEKIIFVLKNNGIKSVNKYRVIFWLIHILNMIFAIGKYDMMCYFMAGDYWMICLDLLNKNKTAIVKEKKSS